MLPLILWHHFLDVLRCFALLLTWFCWYYTADTTLEIEGQLLIGDFRVFRFIYLRFLNNLKLVAVFMDKFFNSKTENSIKNWYSKSFLWIRADFILYSMETVRSFWHIKTIYESKTIQFYELCILTTSSIIQGTLKSYSSCF